MARVPVKREVRVIKYDSIPVELGPPTVSALGCLRHAFGPALGIDPSVVKPGVRYVTEVFRGKTPMRAVRGVVLIMSKIKPGLAVGFKAVSGSQETLEVTVSALLYTAKIADQFMTPFFVVVQLPTPYAQWVGLSSPMRPQERVIPGMRIVSLCSGVRWGTACFVVDGRVVDEDAFVKCGVSKSTVMYEAGAVVADQDVFTFVYAANLSTIHGLLGAYAMKTHKYVLSILQEVIPEEPKKQLSPLSVFKKLAEVVKGATTRKGWKRGK